LVFVAQEASQLASAFLLPMILAAWLYGSSAHAHGGNTSGVGRASWQALPWLSPSAGGSSASLPASPWSYPRPWGRNRTLGP
jgi:hypothetical protein